MSPQRIFVSSSFVFAALLAAWPGMAAENRFGRDLLREDFGFTEETPSDVPWSEVTQGCPKRDCIPAIDQPKFLPAKEATFLVDDDLVLGIVRGGVARAYPTYILDHHEIVNDVIAGDPVAITWCPLCGSGVAFLRVIDGKAVELGVSGVLRESDLVLYDRTTQSLWQQITGKSFAGPSRGQRLEPLSLSVTPWGQWRAAHPETEVLTTDKPRPEKPAYGDYRTSDRLISPVSRRSERLHPKTVVWGVEVAGGSLAVTERRFAADPIVETELAGQKVTLSRQPDGSIKAVRIGDRSQLVVHRMFWFAWFTFHPDTSLVDTPVKK